MNKFLSPIILILLAVGMFFFYVDPQWQKVKELQATNAEYNKAIEQSNQLLEVRDGLLDKYNSFRPEDLNRLEKLLPDNIDNVRLIIDINSITSKYGSSIKNVKLSTPSIDTERSDSGYKTMILSFALNASYDNFLNILGDLERSLRLLDVISISFKAGDKEPYEYTISIRTYWLQ
ncbi:MAG: hypothetical protein NUV47_00880 [Patescibacteria group bacterium]|nr:hypothetical protein [Patescibacteria group bacterium]